MKLLSTVLLAGIVAGSSVSADEPAKPFEGKSKQDYLELRESLKKGTDKLPSINKAIEKNDWGACRDYCYQQRNDCFNSGNDAYICDSWYDSCVAGCDALY